MSRPHSEVPADYRDLAELYRELCDERDALEEQLEALRKAANYALTHYERRDGGLDQEDFFALAMDDLRAVLYPATRPS